MTIFLFWAEELIHFLELLRDVDFLRALLHANKTVKTVGSPFIRSQKTAIEKSALFHALEQECVVVIAKLFGMFTPLGHFMQ